jgi:hypothetical protein
VYEAWPSTTPDQLTLYFEGDAGRTGSLFFASWSTVEADFSPAVVIPIPNPGHGCNFMHPYILPDRSFYFTSDCDGTADLYGGTADEGQLSALRKLVNVNTGESNEALPTLPPDGLTIYFGSDRTGPTLAGPYDIWMATRSSKSDDFGAPVAVAEVNTPGNNEVPIWVSPDNCRLYFSRKSTGYQLFIAERAP